MAYLDRFRSIFAAVAFAEAGEFDTARSMVCDTPEPARSRVFKTLENAFAAVAFAEGGMFREAEELTGSAAPPRRVRSGVSFLDVVGLQHAPVHLVCVTAD